MGNFWITCKHARVDKPRATSSLVFIWTLISDMHLFDLKRTRRPRLLSSVAWAQLSVKGRLALILGQLGTKFINCHGNYPRLKLIVLPTIRPWILGDYTSAELKTIKSIGFEIFQNTLLDISVSHKLSAKKSVILRYQT